MLQPILWICLPAAIRQAIAKSLVAFYQKCELIIGLCLSAQTPALQHTMHCTPLLRWNDYALCCNATDVDEQSKREIKDILLQYDRTLLVADPRRCEPKKCVSACSQMLSVHDFRLR